MITEDILDLMKEAGFEEIGFSLESAVPKVLRTIGKVHPPEDNPSDTLKGEEEFIERLGKMTAYATKIGMKMVYISVMIGLPGETIADALKTIEAVRNLKVIFYMHNLFLLYPGTPINEEYKKYGYQLEYIDKNEIFSKVIYPDDFTNKIPYAANSKHRLLRNIQDSENYKIISLSTFQKIQGQFFKNIILCSPRISQELVFWMQHNLSINGQIIHIYSDKDSIKKYSEENLNALFIHRSPSLQYDAYYSEQISEKQLVIVSVDRFLPSDEPMGLTLNLVNTQKAVSDCAQNQLDFRQTIGIDHDRNDTNFLFHILEEFAYGSNSFETLLEKRPYPFLANLCRWTKNFSNCRTYETAIIDEQGQIRICWKSDPIGDISMSFAEIQSNFEKLKMKVYQKRGCHKCVKNDLCSKCVFPRTLSDEEFCAYQLKDTIANSAEELRGLDVLKSFI